MTGSAYKGGNTPYLNQSSFSPTATGFGSLARNSLRSPSNYQLNLGLAKTFKFRETFKLQFRTEAFNLFNNIQWGTPNTNLDDNFNVQKGIGFGTIRSTAPFSNRQIQFGFRLEF